MVRRCLHCLVINRVSNLATRRKFKVGAQWCNYKYSLAGITRGAVVSRSARPEEGWELARRTAIAKSILNEYMMNNTRHYRLSDKSACTVGSTFKFSILNVTDGWELLHSSERGQVKRLIICIGDVCCFAVNERNRLAMGQRHFFTRPELFRWARTAILFYHCDAALKNATKTPRVAVESAVVPFDRGNNKAWTCIKDVTPLPGAGRPHPTPGPNHTLRASPANEHAEAGQNNPEHLVSRPLLTTADVPAAATKCVIWRWKMRWQDKCTCKFLDKGKWERPGIEQKQDIVHGAATKTGVL